MAGESVVARLAVMVDANTTAANKAINSFQANLKGTHNEAAKMTVNTGKANRAVDGFQRNLKSTANETSKLRVSTGQANREVDAFQRNISATHNATTRATASTSRMGTATGSAATSFKRAAVTAGSALAAYLSISQAKAAVTTTQELAKATLSLHLNFGLATKDAADWASVAESRGIDNNKLGMTFRTLGKNVTAATRGGETQQKMFDRLGISTVFLRQHMNDMNAVIPKVAEGIKNLGPGMDATSTEATLFGRNWQVLAPILRDGAGALKENLKSLRDYGAELRGKALKDQQTLLGELRENKAAWTGLQVQFTKALTPAIIDVSNQFQHMARIMADKRLTDDEKFAQIARIIKRDFAAAFDVIVKLIPTVASNVGAQAPKIAGALVQGFIRANVWGKLLLASWFIGKLGGWAAVRKVATALATRMVAFFTAEYLAETKASQLLSQAFPARAAAGSGAVSGTAFGTAFALAAAVAIPAVIIGAITAVLAHFEFRLPDLIQLPSTKEFRASVAQWFDRVKGTVKESVGKLVQSAKVAWKAISGIHFGAILREAMAKVADTATDIAHDVAHGFRKGRDAVVNAFTSGFRDSLAWIRRLPGRIGGFIAGVVRAVVRFFVHRAQDVRNAIIGGFQDAIRWIKNLPGRVIGAIKAAFGKVLKWMGHVVTWFFDAGKQIITGLANGIKDAAMAPVNAVKDVAGDVEHAVTHPWEIFSPSRKAMRIGKAIVDGLADGIDKASSRAVREMKQLMNKLTDASQNGVRDIDRAWAKLPHQLSQTFDKLGDLMASLARVTDRAGAFLVKAVQQMAKSMGVKAKVPTFSLKLPDLKTKKFQRGGMTMVPGSGEGDRVRALLEPGEVVVNKKAVAALGGARKVNALNDMIPRFQAGGVMRDGVVHAAGGWLVSQAGMQDAAKALANKFLSSFGGNITSAAADRTGTDTFHEPGLAFDWTPGDANAATAYANKIGPQLLEGIHNPAQWGHMVSWDNGQRVSSANWGPSTWADHIDHLHVATRQAISGAAGVMEQIGKIIVQGGTDLLRPIPQAGVDNMRNAANDWLSRHAPSVGLEAMGGNNRELARQMMMMTPGKYKTDASMMRWGPWGASEWPALNRLWTSESNFNTHATNPTSGAYGIPQSLPASKMAAAGSDWKDNPATQIAWGLDYIKENYGAPSNTPLGGYKVGGIVQRFAEGGIADFPDYLKDLLAGPGRHFRHQHKHMDATTRRKKFGEEITDDFRKAMKSMGLPDWMTKMMGELAENADIHADYASRSETLASVVAGSGGIFKGKNQIGWLTEQLKDMFALRNRLVVAIKQAMEQQRIVKNWIDKAKKAIRKIQHDIKHADKDIDHKKKKVDDLNKDLGLKKGDYSPIPKHKMEDVKNLPPHWERKWRRRQDLTQDINKLSRAREVAAKGELPFLKGDKGALAAMTAWMGGRDDRFSVPGDFTYSGPFQSSLNTLQGIGTTMALFRKLPATGILGGDILSLQQMLFDLKHGDVSDDHTQEILALTQAQLEQAQQRLAVSQSQYDVFSQFAGLFAGGGFIPGGKWGIAGERGPEVISGPASVSPNIGGATVELHFADGMGWLEQFVTAKVRQGNQANVSYARRRTGRAGR